MDYDPYVMIYNKPKAPKQIRLLQRWCNSKVAFRAIPNFYDFDPKKRKEMREKNEIKNKSSKNTSNTI